MQPQGRTISKSSPTYSGCVFASLNIIMSFPGSTTGRSRQHRYPKTLWGFGVCMVMELGVKKMGTLSGAPVLDKGEKR